MEKKSTEKKADGETSETTPNAKSVKLGRGGSLSLELTVDLMELEGKDREFVFELIDKINAYEKSVEAAAKEKAKVENKAGEGQEGQAAS